METHRLSKTAPARTPAGRRSRLFTWTVLPLLLGVLGLAACAASTTIETQGRGLASGADARISLETEKSGNHVLSVDVRHLIPPERINPELRRYAVWIKPRGEDIRLAGRLVYDAKDRTGSFETVTPYEDIEVLVTAEPETRTPRPYGRTVLDERISTS